MDDGVEIARLTSLPADLMPLVREAHAGGYRFLERLMEEWSSGTNQFEGRGEVLLAASIRGRLVGIGGLNRDPYAKDPGVGRVRHLYVLREFRRGGVGECLLENIVAAARLVFHELRLRTDNTAAAQFYERFGFRRISDDASTHALMLAERAP